VRITKAHDAQVLAVLRAIHIPEEHIAVLQQGTGTGKGARYLTDVLWSAIFQYAAMHDQGMPICEGDSVVEKPEQPSPWFADDV